MKGLVLKPRHQAAQTWCKTQQEAQIVAQARVNSTAAELDGSTTSARIRSNLGTRMMEELPFAPSDAQVRRDRAVALLSKPDRQCLTARFVPIVLSHPNQIASAYDRWRELKRLVIVHGLPRDDESASSQQPAPVSELTPVSEPAPSDTARCSLRGRVWLTFLGVDHADDAPSYADLVTRGASPCDAEIRNDAFRTFRGDPAFAQRVPEEKLVRLLNAFVNELGGPDAASVRYVQGMNVLCAPLLYVLPEPAAYRAFCQLLVRHCPQYMAPRLQGVEKGCSLVDKCLQTLDPDLYQHLTARGITARIYALPLILSLFACVPPLDELLRVWDVVLGVHFVVVLAVAHTVLLREQLLQNILYTHSCGQLLHRLPDELVYEIARHPFASPDAPASLSLQPETVAAITAQMRKQQKQQARVINRSLRVSTSSTGSSGKKPRDADDVATPTDPTRPTACSTSSRPDTTLATGRARPPWKF
ncbi:hypothetical protein BBJ28_00019082 [Nothophytophthora sp. Chile5]|nr:hypothetical protein BBJ28_00019082 [Nothophytophthora sp. Chile5]